MRVEMLAWFVCELKSSYGRGWILCRRLEWERSTVSSRVALLLRSAEVKLLFYRFVQPKVECFFFSFLFFPWLYFRASSLGLECLVRPCIKSERGEVQGIKNQCWEVEKMHYFCNFCLFCSHLHTHCIYHSLLHAPCYFCFYFYFYLLCVTSYLAMQLRMGI